MPRPNHQLGSSTKSSNPFAQLFNGRKEKRRQEAEQASKNISNDRAETESNMINTLAGINFVRSPIPADILNDKSNSSQPWGDLEYGSRAIQKMISNAPNFNADISAVDIKLMQLVNGFKNAVDQGNVKAAYAAKGALVTCIVNVRNAIPTVPEDFLKSYIENAANYVEIWVQLVDNARVADLLEKNVSNLRLKYEKDVEEMKDKNQMLKDKIISDNDYLQAFADIQDKKAPEDSAMWTETMRKVRMMLVNQKLDNLNLNLSYRILQGQEIKLKKQEGRIETLRARAVSTPIPLDPNSEEKFNEQLDAIINECAAIDTEIDDMLNEIENIEGQLKILDTAPGSIHLRNTIAKQADEFLNQIKQEQEQEISSQGVNQQKLLKKLGIRNYEEQNELIAEAEKENAMQIAEAMKETQQTRQLNYITD